jgi:hypothetical protein
VEEEFLPHSRPLGSFSVRIDMAYILGLIGPQARRDLHLIRKIRNDFGHNIDPVTFDHEPIANRCRELHFHAFDKSESPRRVYVQTAMGLVGTIHATIAKTKHIRERVESLVDADRKKRHQEADAAIGKALEVASQSAKGQDVEAAMRAEQQRLFDAAKAALIAAYMPDAESEDRQTEA